MRSARRTRTGWEGGVAESIAQLSFLAGAIFPFSMGPIAAHTAPLIYFDHNATHPLLPSAREAWLDATERYIGNPSSPHRLGDRADRALTEAREELAGLRGCRPPHISWATSASDAEKND